MGTPFNLLLGDMYFSDLHRNLALGLVGLQRVPVSRSLVLTSGVVMFLTLAIICCCGYIFIMLMELGINAINDNLASYEKGVKEVGNDLQAWMTRVIPKDQYDNFLIYLVYITTIVFYR